LAIYCIASSARNNLLAASLPSNKYKILFSEPLHGI
jgi:hypothetical protein